jgi:hypothetical protein
MAHNFECDFGSHLVELWNRSRIYSLSWKLAAGNRSSAAASSWRRLSPLCTSDTNWPIVRAPECGAIGEMRIGRGNRSPRRKPIPVIFCPPQIAYNLPWARTRTAVAAEGSTCLKPFRILIWIHMNLCNTLLRNWNSRSKRKRELYS